MIKTEIQEYTTKLVYGNPMATTPLISIAIPTYKRLPLLKEAIESALSQKKGSPYEVIVLDNDQSPDILNLVSPFDPSKIVVYQNTTNLGMWGNMNRALDLAKGNWILMLHDDDLLLPDAVHAFEKILTSHNSQEFGCLAGGIETLYEGSIKPLLNTPQLHFRFPISAKWHLSDNVVCASDNMCFIDTPKFCSSFFQRQYIKEIGGWNSEYYAYADLALFLRIVKDGKLFVTREIFGQLRSHDDNDSHPDKLWKSYPVKAAQRLLKDCVDETTIMGRNVYASIERRYTTALWKRRYTSEERKAYAAEVLQLLDVKSLKQRFLLHNVWLIDILSKLYGTVRPGLGSVSRLVFRGRS